MLASGGGASDYVCVVGWGIKDNPSDKSRRHYNMCEVIDGSSEDDLL